MSRIGDYVIEQEQKAVDNGSEDYEVCQEPDFKSYARAVMQSDEYRRDMEEYYNKYEQIYILNIIDHSRSRKCQE